jgi:hypothetical protein
MKDSDSAPWRSLLRMRKVFATLSRKGASVKWGCEMRHAILALILYTGVAAFCQSAAPVPASPEQQWLILPGATNSQPARDFSKPPQECISPRLPQG